MEKMDGQSMDFTKENIEKLKKLFPSIFKDGKIDFVFMEIFISAIKKLAIKDVVLYNDKKIEATKTVIS